MRQTRLILQPCEFMKFCTACRAFEKQFKVAFTFFWNETFPMRVPVRIVAGNVPLNGKRIGMRLREGKKKKRPNNRWQPNKTEYTLTHENGIQNEKSFFLSFAMPPIL